MNPFDHIKNLHTKKCSDVCSPIAVWLLKHKSNVNNASLMSASHSLFRA